MNGYKELHFGEKEQLEEWIVKFRDYKNYPIVGRLIPDDQVRVVTTWRKKRRAHTHTHTQTHTHTHMKTASKLKMKMSITLTTNTNETHTTPIPPTPRT